MTRRTALAGAALVVAPTVSGIEATFAAGQIEAYATNKAILFEAADHMPGARVLEGSWGLEHLAAAIPKGRPLALEYMRAFIAEAQASGLLASAISASGLRAVARR